MRAALLSAVVVHVAQAQYLCKSTYGNSPLCNDPVPVTQQCVKVGGAGAGTCMNNFGTSTSYYVNACNPGGAANVTNFDGPDCTGNGTVGSIAIGCLNGVNFACDSGLPMIANTSLPSMCVTSFASSTSCGGTPKAKCVDTKKCTTYSGSDAAFNGYHVSNVCPESSVGLPAMQLIYSREDTSCTGPVLMYSSYLVDNKCQIWSSNTSSRTVCPPISVETSKKVAIGAGVGILLVCILIIVGIIICVVVCRRKRASGSEQTPLYGVQHR